MAVAIGFVGTLIVIQPSWELFGWVSLLPLGTATLFAIYLILNRRYGDADTPLVMQLYAGVGGTVTVAVALLLGQLFDVSDMTFDVPWRPVVVSPVHYWCDSDGWASPGRSGVAAGTGVVPGAFPVSRDRHGGDHRACGVQ